MIPASRIASTGEAERWLRLVLLALAFALSVALGACSAAGDDGEATRRGGSGPGPLFYEIAREDGTVRGWLFGTIHALPAGTRWRTPVIDRATAEADSLVVEVATLGDAAAAARLFRDLGTTPGLPPLADRVPPEQRAALAALADRAGMNLARQQRTESWAAAMMLARVSAEGSPEHGVERALLRDFAGRPVRELEGAAGQLGIFDRLPEEAQRALLAAVVAASDPAQSAAARLREAWLEGDAAALEAATQEGMMADPRLRAALLTERNRAWLGPIEASLHSPGRPLIAVGAAHVVGPEGLVALLTERGWRVTRRP